MGWQAPVGCGPASAPSPVRLATLKEAKAVVTQYHKYLSENSLIRSVFDDDNIALLPPRKNLPKPSA